MSDNMKTVITIVALIFLIAFMFFPVTVKPEPEIKVEYDALKEYSKRFEEYTLEQLVKQIANGENEG